MNRYFNDPIPLEPPQGHEPWMTLLSVAFGDMDMIPDPPTIITVIIRAVTVPTIRGIRQRHMIETNWGRMLYSAYEEALDIAVGYFRFVQIPPGSRVRFTLGNILTVDADEVEAIRDMTSDSRAIRDIEQTTNDLYTAMNYKYASEGYDFDVQVGSGGNLSISPVEQEVFLSYQFTFRAPDDYEAPSVADRQEFVVNTIEQFENRGREDNARNVRRRVAAPDYQFGRTRAERRRLEALRQEARHQLIRPPDRHALARQANLNRGRGRGRGRRRVGDTSYDDRYNVLKEHIYIKRTLGDIFKHSRALISVPETEDLLCFPMAFMRSQLRCWYFKTLANGQHSNEVENIRENVTVDINIEDDVELPDWLVDTSFFNIEKRTIYMFDNTKKPYKQLDGDSRKLLYLDEATELPENEARTWLWCAYQIHEFVKSGVGFDVDATNLEECLIAYSYVFAVNISIFSMDCQGERVYAERLDYNEHPIMERYVAMALQGTHLNAISSIRNYHYMGCKNIAGLQAYCDRCCTSAKNRVVSSHHSKCGIKKDWNLIRTWDEKEVDQFDEGRCAELVSNLPMGSNTADMCKSCSKLVEWGCKCQNHPMGFNKVVVVECKVCNCKVPRNHYNKHECYMPTKVKKDPLDTTKIFVLDLEAFQDKDPATNKYLHECNLGYIMAVYDDREWTFPDMGSLVRFLLDNEFMHGSVFWAHNGGGYDYQFLIRYLEDNNLIHTVTPRPNTLHKYLEVKLELGGPSKNIYFRDFMMLMTDSLRNIGKAFKLPVCKGDFPHKFSKKEHQDYVGPLPPMDSEEDWYSFKQMKNADEAQEARDYWMAQGQKYCTCESNLFCTCERPKWDYQKELKEYCRLDCLVLKEAVKAYRDQAIAFASEVEYDWKMEGIDPLNYMTQSQIAIAFFTRGKVFNDIAVTHDRLRPGFKKEKVRWLEGIMKQNPGLRINHCGNTFKDYYMIDNKCYLDGYGVDDNGERVGYLYKNCGYDACPICHAEEIRTNQIHPTRHIKYRIIRDANNRQIKGLMENNLLDKLIVRWSHEDLLEDNEDTNDEKWNLFGLRDIFYGGRTEVFSAYCNPSKLGMVAEYDDVCSLYPYVCSHKEMPIGYPEMYYGEVRPIDIARLYANHEDPYFGFAKVRILPNDQDLIGVLPERIDGKLKYTLHEKIGVWHTEFIHLALDRGYKILEVYEVWHWPLHKRSVTAMRGYMQFFLRMKQEAEGWVKLGKDIYTKEELNNLTDEMKTNICDYIYKQNGDMARPRPECVEVNPVKRQLAKIFLNCLWGKLCQKSAPELEKFIYGLQQYLRVIGSKRIDQSTVRFRHVNGGVYKARFKHLEDIDKLASSFINIPMAASVTAHAQVLLMRQMFVVGPERVLYCDTDSIIYLKFITDPKYTSTGLGNWADEYPDKILKRFVALAPKCYAIDIEDDSMLFKCKGVRMTAENKRRTAFDELLKLVTNVFLPGKGLETIQTETMLIQANSIDARLPYGKMTTVYGSKDVRTVFSKRVLTSNTIEGLENLDNVALIRLVPEGYKGEHTHVYTNN